MEVVGGEFHAALAGRGAFGHAVEAHVSVVVGYYVEGLLVL